MTVNGDAREVTEGTTVARLVDGLGGQAKGTAVAVNEEVIPRSRWHDAELAPGDRVEVLTASRGG